MNWETIMDERDPVRLVAAEAVLDRAEDIADVHRHNLAVTIVNQLSKALRARKG